MEDFDLKEFLYMYVHLSFLYATKQSSELFGSDFYLGTLKNQVLSKEDGLHRILG